MNIFKCDICNKVIEGKTQSIHLGIGGFFGNRAEFCEKCAEPILNFLKDKKIINNETRHSRVTGENKKDEK